MIYLDEIGHIFSDTSLDELYDFCVKKLGMRPEWNHYSRWFPHFDATTKNMQAKAQAAGAKFITIRETVEMFRKTDVIYKELHKAGKIPWYKDTYKGKELLRVDFKRYFEMK